MTLLTRRSVSPADLFDSVFGPFGGQVLQRSAASVPANFGATDIHESESAFVVAIDTPGAKKEDIDIHVEDGILSIAATVTTESKEEKADKKYLLRERHSGSFRRSFRIPDNVKAEDIKAAFADGTTTITLPKSAPESRAKKIAVS